MEVEDMKEHMKNRSIDEELNQQMTERPPRKEYSLRSRKKQSAVLNYVIQVVRSKMVQEQEGQQLNMKQTSSTSVGQDKWNQQHWSHHPEKEARIHHNMTNASVISALVKSDEPAPHERHNSYKTNNDQCETGNAINAKQAIRWLMMATRGI